MPPCVMKKLNTSTAFYLNPDIFNLGEVWEQFSYWEDKQPLLVLFRLINSSCCSLHKDTLTMTHSVVHQSQCKQNKEQSPFYTAA